MMMDVCRRGTEGSDYTVQASIVVIATGIASAVSGVSAALVGYTGHFVLSGLLCCAGLAIVWRFGCQYRRFLS